MVNYSYSHLKQSIHAFNSFESYIAFAIAMPYFHAENINPQSEMKHIQGSHEILFFTSQ